MGGQGLGYIHHSPVVNRPHPTAATPPEVNNTGSVYTYFGDPGAYGCWDVVSDNANN